jgi:Flp pilus assembly pilin Flp
MRTPNLLRRLASDQGGATALEYALVLPAFIMLLLGTISTSQLASIASSMHFAVQEAARCSAVNRTACGTASATVAYAQTRYRGPDVDPLFVSTTDGCGHTVRATASFELDVGLMTFDVPLAAEACYPGLDQA